MNAIISGRAGVALLIEGDNYQAFDADAPDDVFPCAPDDYHRLFVHADDVEFLTDVDPESVRMTLQQRVAREDALDYVLYLLDGELSDETRRDAAAELNELLTDAPTGEWVEDILFAKPLPESADASGALRLCDEAGLSVVRKFVNGVIAHQEAVAAVRVAWELVPEELFESDGARREVEECCIGVGLFRRLAISVTNGESAPRLHPGILDSLYHQRSGRQIIQSWLARLYDRRGAKLPEQTAAMLDEPRQRTAPNAENKSQFQALVESAAAGSDESISRIVEDYGYAILHVIRARLSPRLRRRFDSQDLVQAVWMSFFRNRSSLNQFGTPDELVSWLRTISANKVIAECRRSLIARKRVTSRKWSVTPRWTLLLDLVPSERQTASAELDREALLESLEPRQRRMVSLRLAGASHAEIADELGVSEGTVRRAFRRLRDR